MPVMPREARDWTIDDLDQLPDDGLQYELLDGMLLVTPPRITDHQRLSRGVFRRLDAAAPDGFEVFFAPLGWQPDNRTSLEPDVLVVAKDQIGVKSITAPLALVVEVLSPSTRRKDTVLKRSKYEDGGVESYWLVDPSGPTVTVLQLRDGHYTEAARATGAEVLEIDQPFPVRIVPAELFD